MKVKTQEPLICKCISANIVLSRVRYVCNKTMLMVLLLTFMRTYVHSSTDIPSRSNALFLCPTSYPVAFHIPIFVRIHSKLYIQSTGKSLSEALLFAEHGENMLCTKIVLNVRNNFCTQHILPRFELGIFMY